MSMGYHVILWFYLSPLYLQAICLIEVYHFIAESYTRNHYQLAHYYLKQVYTRWFVEIYGNINAARGIIIQKQLQNSTNFDV